MHPYVPLDYATVSVTVTDFFLNGPTLLKYTAEYIQLTFLSHPLCNQTEQHWPKLGPADLRYLLAVIYPLLSVVSPQLIITSRTL